MTDHAGDVLGHAQVASRVAGVYSRDDERPSVVDQVLVIVAERVDDGVVLAPANVGAGIGDHITRQNDLVTGDRRQHVGNTLTKPRRNCNDNVIITINNSNKWSR